MNKLYLSSLIISIFLSSGCAQAPVADHYRDAKSFSSPANFAARTLVDAKNHSVVIFVYPENGAVSEGRYYRLPLEVEVEKE